MKDWYTEKVEKAEQNHPHLEDRFCSKCGHILVRSSANWEEGFHFDGCPYDEVDE